MEDNIEIPQKIKNRAKIKKIKNLAVLLLVIYPKRTKSLIKNDIGTFIFTAALFTTAKIWKQRVPNDG